MRNIPESLYNNFVFVIRNVDFDTVSEPVCFQIWFGHLALKVCSLSFGNDSILEALRNDVSNLNVKIGSALEVASCKNVLALIFGFNVFDNEFLDAFSGYKLINFLS